MLETSFCCCINRITYCVQIPFSATVVLKIRGNTIWIRCGVGSVVHEVPIATPWINVLLTCVTHSQVRATIRAGESGYERGFFLFISHHFCSKIFLFILIVCLISRLFYSFFTSFPLDGAQVSLFQWTLARRLPAWWAPRMGRWTLASWKV